LAAQRNFRQRGIQEMSECRNFPIPLLLRALLLFFLLRYLYSQHFNVHPVVHARMEHESLLDFSLRAILQGISWGRYVLPIAVGSIFAAFPGHWPENRLAVYWPQRLAAFCIGSFLTYFMIQLMRLR